MSPVASKASSGALERMDVRSVGVMPRFLARCVEEGWDVFGTDNSADAEAVTDVKVLKPSVVVVGNGAYLLTLFVWAIGLTAPLFFNSQRVPVSGRT